MIDVSEHKPRRIPSKKWRELIKKVWEDAVPEPAEGPPGSTPPATKSLFGDGIDIPAGFSQPFLNAIVAPDPCRHVFGPCGPRPTGVAEKRFLIKSRGGEAGRINREG